MVGGGAAYVSDFSALRGGLGSRPDVVSAVLRERPDGWVAVECVEPFGESVLSLVVRGY